MTTWYSIQDAVTGTVYGERSSLKDAKRLARQYPGAVVKPIDMTGFALQRQAQAS